MKVQLNFWIFIFRRFHWKIRSHVGINTCYLCKKYSSFVFHWTFTATAATIIHLYFLHQTMASNGNIFDTPQKNKHCKSLVLTNEKKTSSTKLSMSPSTPSTVSSWLSTVVLLSLSPSLSPSSSPLSLPSSSPSLLSVVSQTKKRLLLTDD